MMALTALCCTAKAQQKQSGATAPGRHNTVVARKVIDKANLRIKYAWNATDLRADSTYLDCGQLLMGKRMTKYSSWFVEVADSQRVAWAKKNPHAGGVPNGTWWMRGKKPDIWSEYQYSDIFIHGDTLNEWAMMPLGQEWPQRYEEKWKGQDWKLETEKTTVILGHHCQKATCHWRGRDYVAWFAPDIPIRRGPWKFGGLPGLILKIYDINKLYTFEAVAIEKATSPSTSTRRRNSRSRRANGLGNSKLPTTATTSRHLDAASTTRTRQASWANLCLLPTITTRWS